jgi:tRNA(Met) cytidine acetyltransferase
MDYAGLGADLRAAARRRDHRRLIVLAGDRSAGVEAARALLTGADVTDVDVAAVTAREDSGYAATDPAGADRLLGATRTAVLLDCHDRFAPNALGQVAGVVDGGGLLVLLTPPLDAWPDRRDAFDEGLAVPPFGPADVSGRFRRRLVGTLDHPTVTVVDVDAGEVRRDGRGETTPDTAARATPTVPPVHAFPAATYEACLTADQVRAVSALEGLRDPGTAVVVEADRGRGKSAAAGLAAAALATAGRDVLVTAPGRERAEELFVRAGAHLGTLGAERPTGRDRPTGEPSVDSLDAPGDEGGRIRFAPPPAAAAAITGDGDGDGGDDGEGGKDGGNRVRPDVVLVDEAAGVPVRLLARLLEAPAAGFFTTVHGYEGAGRGFSVRFRDRLDEFDGRVVDVRLDEPIRYAPGDPVEAWTNRALLLDAAPAVDAALTDTDPTDCEYRRLAPGALATDEHLLREAFGLLVAAHYRTEPDDLARLLDAPNLRVRALASDGHVVSVALLAREGGLDADTRRASYEGARIRGNMLPDVLTSQVRDEAAGEPVGYRVVRIATHAAVRSRGLGSRLLEAIAREVEGGGRRTGHTEADGPDPRTAGTPEARTAAAAASDDRVGGPLESVDWLGVAYGATPELVAFWAANGYRTVQLATSRNATSGEYSALMLRPTTAAGRDLHDRHAAWFLRRAVGLLGDSLSDLDADVARAALGAADAAALPPVELSEWGWRTVAAAAYGPGLYDVAPGPFRPLVRRALVAGAGDDRDGDGDGGGDSGVEPEPGPGSEPDVPDLTAAQQRLLVRKVLQARSWATVATARGESKSECMRAFGRACRPLVDAYGADAARAERDRYRD